MDGKKQIFLSTEEAVSAIRIDFSQYPPQTSLFMALTPLILGADVRVATDSQGNSLWVSTPGRRHMRRLRKITPRDLGRLLIDTLAKSTPSPGVMAEICQQIFLLPAVPSVNSREGKAGVWIYMHMDGFQCRQCGGCCRKLKYRHDVSPGDYRRWEVLGRDDILERVATITRGGRIVSYAIWVEPGTRHFSEICPWLSPATPKKQPDHWICRIHDVKPDICREYPGTRKHARMTGCTGFDG